jgi:tRNA threonylcarbamoyladenosine biosynthesis protein TsaE
MSQTASFQLADETATLALAAAISRCIEPGLLVLLEGDLGSGKTTLVRGLLRALGDSGPVRSPTYTLVELHAISGIDLYHFDFYRLNQPEEFLDAGLEEYFGGNGICLVEWPQRAGTYLPPADLRVRLAIRGGGRSADIDILSARGQRCLERLPPIDGTSFDLPPPA